jgi:hypothetical protein
MYSLMMKRGESEQVEPLPRPAVFIVAGLVVLVGFVLVGGKLYLANWRGDMLFLPVALFLGFLLVAAVVRRFFRKN